MKITMKNVRRQAGRIHPLMATAAVAITVVSLVGVAALTGLIPTSQGQGTPPVSAMSGQTPLMTATPNEPAYDRTQYGNEVPPAQARAYVPPPPVVQHATPRTTSSNSNNGNDYAQQNTQVAQATCTSCGRVESVVALHQAAPASGVGIGVGAVLGGLLGNQVGGGNGRTLATVAGAVAGGYGGNEVEKRSRTTTSYQVRVRMENGTIRTFPQDGEGWRVGDRVRVVNGALTSRS